MRLKRELLFAAIVVLALAPAAPAAASGGGGCGEPITEERGAEVDIEGFCFTPTVLYAAPGDTVTWTNRDPVPHNVGGANMAWGSFEQIRRGKSISHTFSEPGVYSYVCSLHPGMAGTVVVGGDVAMSPASAVAPPSDEIPKDIAMWVAAAAMLAATAGLATGMWIRRRVRD
ncbi:MAG: cupredoxin domain-containing protein [Actinomycetota bacterium]